MVVVGGAINQSQRNRLRGLIDYFVLPAVSANHGLPAAAADELRARTQAAAARPLRAQLSLHMHSK